MIISFSSLVLLACGPHTYVQAYKRGKVKNRVCGRYQAMQRDYQRITFDSYDRPIATLDSIDQIKYDKYRKELPASKKACLKAKAASHVADEGAFHTTKMVGDIIGSNN